MARNVEIDTLSDTSWYELADDFSKASSVAESDFGSSGEDSDGEDNEGGERATVSKVTLA